MGKELDQWTNDNFLVTLFAVSWYDICAFSRQWCNTENSKFPENLVFQSTCPVFGSHREAKINGETAEAVCWFIDNMSPFPKDLRSDLSQEEKALVLFEECETWNGYAKRDIDWLEWYSGSSDTTLQAEKCPDGAWICWVVESVSLGRVSGYREFIMNL